MDRLRRIIINKSENGYMFSIKDLGSSYKEAAPVNKVVANGPADCAGLRSGDGVVAINSNLVKGKTYLDLCNIIKSYGDTCLELTIIENYCLPLIRPDKSKNELQLKTFNCITVSSEEFSAEKYSPIARKKKAYSYGSDELKRLSVQSNDEPTSYNSAVELCSQRKNTDLCNDDTANHVNGHFKAVRLKNSRTKDKIDGNRKPVALSDLNLNIVNKISQSDGVIRSKMTKECNPIIINTVYHQDETCKDTSIKRSPNYKSERNEIGARVRRVSTTAISDFTPRLTVPCRSSTESLSTGLQLNRVGGLIRAPLFIEELPDFYEECNEDIDSMLDSLDTLTTENSSETIATTESDRSCNDLDSMGSSSRVRFRYMNGSPMPYKSNTISTISSMSSEITPTIGQSHFQFDKSFHYKVDDKSCNNISTKSTFCVVTSSPKIDIPDIVEYKTEPYCTSLVHDYYVPGKDGEQDGTLELGTGMKHNNNDTKTFSLKQTNVPTVPNLSTTKYKTNVQISIGDISTSDLAVIDQSSAQSQSNKGVIQQAMSRVKHFRRKFSSNGQISDFERQQGELFHNSGSNMAKLESSSSFCDYIVGGLDSVVTLDQTLTESESAELPLHKWPRSSVSHLVPLVVELCVSIVEMFAMNHIGLYRVSGNKVALDYIFAELHKPLSDIDVNTDKWNDLHAVSGVLKSFFRHLPDSLFPQDLYSDIIGACRMHEFDQRRRLLSIQRFLSIMDMAHDHPEYRYHRETLHYLAEHLSRVASRQSVNRMTVKNLAMIFAPSLMRSRHETTQILINDYKYKILLIETVIKYHQWLFSPIIDSSDNIPSDITDDNCMENELLSDDQRIELPDNINPMTLEVKDARPFVKKILSRAKKLRNECPGTSERSSIDKTALFTLAELLRQYHEFNCVDVGFKEVDIDEECEKRKGKVENNIGHLKAETKRILSLCSKDIEDLNEIQRQCHEELHQVKLKLESINDEIVKTENLLERTTERNRLSRCMTSQPFQVQSRSLSSLSVTLASSLLRPHSSIKESQKARATSTEV